MHTPCLVHNAVYFSPLQVKNKPHEGVMNVCLILGILARLQILRSLVQIRHLSIRHPHCSNTTVIRNRVQMAESKILTFNPSNADIEVSLKGL